MAASDRARVRRWLVKKVSCLGSWNLKIRSAALADINRVFLVEEFSFSISGVGIYL